MNDASRFALSVLIGALAFVYTIVTTGTLLFSIGVGVIIINGSIVILRPEVWNWLLYGGTARNEGQFVITTMTSVFLILEFTNNSAEFGTIHILTVVVALTVGVSSGLHNQQHKE
ncbi:MULTISPECIES: hypothetical protein [Halorussus]|uniref:Uncharacterized protein n=2 Tax=Halorussus TaxID=1070314 RepID=A0A8U0I1Y5_9EURY|nr:MULTISPECIES: hypothetical protein [Halorussus]UPV77227.1 hypothetical protein M0R89_22930 [Halorussus limi]